ncbi:hypothetical protein D9758_015374 [Tetrapyrgos nigripes]|uniref:Peptidase C14 caspase domain-containing protein n=1 Tax=Tetrapyrgos nigripes TaxID=182062 RepID=A0A8H5FI71_9AGAR|nr:hypothetical protein D9758_015374 [Tetrapyrgos nigripes]
MSTDSFPSELEASEVQRPLYFCPPSLYALVIGINAYKHHDIMDLKGCVKDTEDIIEFLKGDLGVKEQNIVRLLNQDATRANIIQRLEDMAKTDMIPRDSAILIYFAGHGAQHTAPLSDNKDKKIQMLLPHDFIPRTNADINAQGIPDAKLSALLSNLADAKGNNITVIMDSCHSGSGTRSDDVTKEHSVRSIDLPHDYDILPSILQHAGRSMNVAAGHEHDGLASHVLLAACSRDGQAREIYQRGQFTKALTTVLRDPRHYTDTISYQDVIRLLPDLSLQVPQCEGKYDQRILFKGIAPKRSRRLWSLKSSHETFTIDTGEAQGVTEAARFAIYPSPDMNSHVITYLVAEKVSAYSTILRWSSATDAKPPIPPSAWAVQTHAGKDVNIPVAFMFEKTSPAVFQHIIDILNQNPGRKVIPASPEVAELVVIEESGRAVFHLTDHICCQSKLRCLPSSVSFNAENIYAILKHVAEFFWALRHSKKLVRTPSSPHSSLQLCVRIEAWKLTVKYAESRPHLTPTGENLNVCGVIQIPIVDGAPPARYGFKIISTHNRPLYVWVFSFNMSDLSIHIIYHPNFSKTADPCLSPRGELDIGYGSGGSRPQSFYLPPDMTADVSYLKVFVTTQFVDFSDIEKLSPFEPGRKSMPNRLGQSQPEMWDALLVPIIQSRIGRGSKEEDKAHPDAAYAALVMRLSEEAVNDVMMVSTLDRDSRSMIDERLPSANEQGWEFEPVEKFSRLT